MPSVQELAEGVEGLIHVSEFDDSDGQEKVELEVDQSRAMKIIKLSPADRKIGLSIRALNSGEEEDRETYGSSNGSPKATLGDHMKRT